MPLEYDREELYLKVWEQPMLKVAEEYGISSVALGKVCRKLAVPVPGRGYWAKLAHGHAVPKKPPLPKLEKVPHVYRSQLAEQKRANVHDPNDPELAAIDLLLSSGALCPPPFDPSTSQHVLIRRTANRLRSESRKDEHGILLPREPGGLDVRVTAAALERALQVMAQVLAVLEIQGARVEVSEQGGASAFTNGWSVSFGIEEPVRRVVTQKPRVPNPTDRWDYDQSVSYEATGHLVLVIHSGTWNSPRLPRWLFGL